MSAGLAPNGNQTRPAATDFAVRLLSALILAAGAVTVAYLGNWYFCALICVGCLVLAWEWWRLSGADQPTIGWIINSLTILFAVVVFWMQDALLAFAALAVGSTLSLIYSVGTSRTLWTALGPSYIGLPAFGLLWLREDPEWGFLAIMFVFVVVWSTDSAAYLTGRTIGGPKLWPRVSPNKTWAGLIGGAVAGTVSGGLLAILAGLPAIVIVAGMAFVLSIAAQGGDLLESSIKRQFHKKDASHLIPGHGGLFDRVDGLIVAILLAAIIVMIKDNRHPAQALLLW